MTDFANALQPLTHAYDGIFIHSRGGSGSGIGSGNGLKGDLRIRTDLSVPVFMFETQTDLTTLGYAPAQQPNTARIRTWEVAGTSHADAYVVGGNGGLLGCTQPINDGPQHEVVQAAFTAFDKWVVDGTAPPTPSPFHLASTNPATYATDKNGNVIGGVRTPAVDVPISTLSGQAPPGATVICSLFGSATRSVRPPWPRCTRPRRTTRGIHQELGQGHQGRLHPGGRPLRDAGPGPKGSHRRTPHRGRNVMSQNTGITTPGGIQMGTLDGQEDPNDESQDRSFRDYFVPGLLFALTLVFGVLAIIGFPFSPGSSKPWNIPSLR